MNDHAIPGDRLPPNNLDAERAVLGAALIDAEALKYIIEVLGVDDFYEPHHAMAYEVMLDMASKDRSVDHITFSDELVKRDLFDRLGGRQFIAMLLDSVTVAANTEHHCAIVKDKSIHRSLIRVGSNIAKVGFDEEIDSDSALADAEKQVYDIAGKGKLEHFRDMSSVVLATFSQIERSLSDDAATKGIETGFADFDRLTGGFQKGSLNIIAARPSMGKTAWALNVAQYAALHNDVNVLIFSLEMSAEQLANRLLSAESAVNVREMIQTRSVVTDQWNALTDASARLSSAPIFIDDSSMLTTLELRSKCRRFFSKHRDEPSIVIVDYLQLMANSRKTENRQQEVSDISRSLKGVAREFDVPVIALSQLSREVEKRGNDKRPVLSDLRDSGAIEQDADLVAFLYRPAYYQNDKDNADPSAEMSIAKHRNGPTGKVDLVFFKEISKFEGKTYYQ